MGTITTTLTPASLVASASISAGGNARAARDMKTKHGGLVTMKITNGGTGPTTQCEGRVMIAHNSGSTPATGSAGADWKTIFVFGGGTTASTVTEQHIVVPPCCSVQVEFIGHTGQAVTAEADITDYTALATA